MPRTPKKNKSPASQKKSRRSSSSSSKKQASRKPSSTKPAKPEEEIMTGTLRLHVRGFGFVIPDHPGQHPQDVFIPKHQTDHAVDGDHVEVAIHPVITSEKGPEGRILSILKRGRTHLAGILSRPAESGINPPWMVHVPLLGTNRPVVVKPSAEHPMKEGDRVILKVLEWGKDDAPTLCEVSHLIGHIEDPSCDIPAAIEEFDLPSAFPAAAIQQAQAWGSTVSAKDLKGRVDLTEECCFTIDPETAKDFDDALHLKVDKNGHFHLGVHIADVAHYVPAGSPLDLEATERSNSTYFPGFCLPMLPHELSSELCSLKEGVIRLTVSVLMSFDPEGNLLTSKIVRSYIHSKKRFTYGEAREVLEGKKSSPFLADLERMVQLCKVLKKQRYTRGSIDFSLPDLIVLVDEKGRPYGLKIEEYDITHQLVEEFMLKANEVVAKTLTERGKTLLYRIHEEPAEENMEEFFAMARALGFALPLKPEQNDLQKLFEQAKTTPFSQQLAVGFIRNMKLATYSPDNVGHFGLALEHYCHFTSPIRRYSDLIAQRLLFDEEEEGLDYEKIAQHCSDQERLSFKAESSVKLLKKLRLLKTYLSEDPEKFYPAIITRIKPFGISFEMQPLSLEGFLHISELEDDYFTYEPNGPSLVGRGSKRRHVIGGALSVRPLVVDLIHLECKWQLSGCRKQRPKKDSSK